MLVTNDRSGLLPCSCQRCSRSRALPQNTAGLLDRMCNWCITPASEHEHAETNKLISQPTFLLLLQKAKAMVKNFSLALISSLSKTQHFLYCNFAVLSANAAASYRMPVLERMSVQPNPSRRLIAPTKVVRAALTGWRMRRSPGGLQFVGFWCHRARATPPAGGRVGQGSASEGWMSKRPDLDGVELDECKPARFASSVAINFHALDGCKCAEGCLDLIVANTHVEKVSPVRNRCESVETSASLAIPRLRTTRMEHGCRALDWRRPKFSRPKSSVT